MNSKERVLQREKERGKPVGKLQGKSDAIDLAKRAVDMDGTAIIAEEHKVPLFVWGTDYSGCPVGAPIGEIIDGELQVFTMLTPVNTANHPGITPNKERSLYSLCHTKDPAKAKPWVPPLGISGLYKEGECYRHADGTVRRCIALETNFNADEYPPYWETVTL